MLFYYSFTVGQSVIIDIASKVMMLVLILSLPSILLATIVGLGVSLLQALTQVQEQTLSFAVRLICITLVLLFSAHWIGNELIKYIESIFIQIPRITGK